MIFDELQNGIPIAFLITCHGKEEDTTPWLWKLNQRLFEQAFDWYPNVIIFDNAQVEPMQLGLTLI
jgi:hypothetical protein